MISPIQRLEQLLRECTVKLCLPGHVGGSGSGFFVAPGYILTCAHVVGKGEQIEAMWNGHSYPVSEVTRASEPPDGFPDLLLLKITISGHPCVLLDDSMPVAGDKVYGFGFPEHTAVKVDSTSFTGEIEGISYLDTSKLRPLVTFKGAQIIGGMSGSPVMNIRTGCICGMIKRTREDNASRAYDAGGRLIHSGTIFQYLSDIIETQAQFHLNNTEWKSLQAIVYTSPSEQPGRAAISIPNSSNTTTGFATGWGQKLTPTPVQVLHIFISSPSDVARERSVASQVIENLMHDPLLRDKAILRMVAWDRPNSRTPMLAAVTPQEAINEGMAKPSECDIVIVILWSRMGMRLPAEYKKPDGSPFLSGTEYEFEDAVNAARNCRTRPVRPQVLVYRCSKDITVSVADPEKFEKIKQAEHVEDFFRTFIAPDGSLKGEYNSYATPDDLRTYLENDLKVIINRLLEAAPLAADQTATVAPADLRTPEHWKGSPFPGLRPFLADEAPIFFGRGREIDSLLSRISDPGCRFVCVIGASGSGKSSLVGAGLLPQLASNALEGSKDWVWTSFTPGGIGDDPFVALAVALTKKFSTLEKRWPRARDLADELASGRGISTVSGVLMNLPAWAELLLFIDQFEELFTLAAERYRLPFIDLLDSLTKTPRLRIVATLRSDFYHRCMDYPQLTDLLLSGSYTLSAPKLGALHDMVARPADIAGLRFEEALVQRILDDTAGDPGALALMAYTLDELYRSCTSNHSSDLTHRAYDSLGGVQGAIGTRAQLIFDKLDPDTQAALPGVFRELVDVDERGVATRHRVMLNRITGGDDNSAAARLVQALTHARLLVQNKGIGDHPMVEVAHEALLQSWPRLASWITEAQDDLILLRQVRLAAAQWDERNRHRDFLWPDGRLQQVYRMQERLKPGLTEVERDFIRPEWEWLVDELDDPGTSHFRRSQIGYRLAGIGDKRRGVGLLPAGLPDIAWCYVPSGTVHLEDEQHSTFDVRSFKIGKYPITYIQFRAFVEDECGYYDAQWWDGLPPTQAHGEQNISIDNHPADYVSWCDATAFCRWLTVRYVSAQLVDADCIIRLPTEWEWQQAASGGESKNEYPWGIEWDSNKANTEESRLNRTIAVGMYPYGAAVNVGALDFGGNINELCQNDYDTLRLDIRSASRRAMRGGSYFEQSKHTRTSRRSVVLMQDRLPTVGFRVACFRASPSSRQSTTAKIS